MVSNNFENAGTRFLNTRIENVRAPENLNPAKMNTFFDHPIKIRICVCVCVCVCKYMCGVVCNSCMCACVCQVNVHPMCVCVCVCVCVTCGSHFDVLA